MLHVLYSYHMHIYMHQVEQNKERLLQINVTQSKDISYRVLTFHFHQKCHDINIDNIDTGLYYIFRASICCMGRAQIIYRVERVI